MANYDTPIREQYYIPSAAFGATTDSLTIIGPKGKRGIVRDIIQTVSADMVGTTTVPEITVGNALNDASYARFRLGTTGILGYTSAAGNRRASQVAGNGDGAVSLQDFTGHVVMGSAFVPADTATVITRKAGTGGSPAGTGATTVIIEWF